ncbi:hypothetical protein [Maridesulfovibrio sp.]|uniref:hypothetical protein n=1 Tax=Maridesulfovibrio sp. TaxID=2795000 RepID=UPI0029CA7ED1|nr:hypothetical protein [Maridesulfovibrio sp.]
MISEYAIDPEVFAAYWKDHFAFFSGAFDDSGRILSQYPKRWKRELWKMVEADADFSDNDLKRLDSLLADKILARSIRRKNSYTEKESWLERAEAEHNDFSFRAILSASNPRKHDDVVELDQLLTTRVPCWECSRNFRVERVARDMIGAINPILHRSKKIYLIDPYLSTEKRYTRVVSEICQAVSSPMSLYPQAEINVFTSVKGSIWRDCKISSGKRIPDSEEKQCVCQTFKKECVDIFPAIIPAGVKITFNVCFEKGGGIDFHDRTILTDIAGVDFGNGLDAKGSGKVVRLKYLDYYECSKLEEDFFSGQPLAYDVECSFGIVGTKG